jgi:hypothetical protein
MLLAGGGEWGVADWGNAGKGSSSLLAEPGSDRIHFNGPGPSNPLLRKLLAFHDVKSRVSMASVCRRWLQEVNDFDATT